MNIQVQCCGLIILIILMIYYFNQRKLFLITEKAFIHNFASAFVSILLDIVSVIAIANMDEWSVTFANVTSKLYLVSIIYVSTTSLMYLYIDVYRILIDIKLYIGMYITVFILGLIVVFMLPIKCVYNPETSELYSYGLANVAAYTCSILILIAIVVIMIKQRKGINASRFKAVFIWMGFWVVAGVIQAVNHKYLVVGYAECLSIMIVYLKLENPEANIDRKTGLFNQGALKLYLREIFFGKKDVAVLSISFERFESKGYAESEDYEELSGFINNLLLIKDCKVFILAQEFILVMNDIDSALGEVERIEQYFKEEWIGYENINLDVNMIFIPNMQKVGNSDDLFALIRYAKEKNDREENILLTVSDKMITNMYHEKEIKQQISKAMDMDLVEVFYQPIYSIKEENFTSMEALVRIRDDEGNIISPAIFIPIAEKNGMIIRLGEIVFEKVCSFVKKNRLRQYGIQYVEVNLSVLQCADERLSEKFINIMEKYKVSPDMINLEITETASMRAKRILLDNMKNLMNYGVNFSLDDFGTGESNLNYIVDMPVSIVKFDKGMTDAYFRNGRASYVMDAAIRMIQGMHLKIVSEGVETEKQFEVMKDLGINYIQGYYFSKPLPELEFLQFIEEKNVNLR